MSNHEVHNLFTAALNDHNRGRDKKKRKSAKETQNITPTEEKIINEIHEKLTTVYGVNSRLVKNFDSVIDQIRAYGKEATPSSDSTFNEISVAISAIKKEIEFIIHGTPNTFWNMAGRKLKGKSQKTRTNRIILQPNQVSQQMTSLEETPSFSPYKEDEFHQNNINLTIERINRAFHTATKS